MVLKIDIFSDPICPWCFIGQKSLDSALNSFSHSYKLRWHPFQTFPNAPKNGIDPNIYLLQRFGGVENVRRANILLMNEALKVGINIDFENISLVPNSFDAHRLIIWSYSTGTQAVAVRSLFEKYFIDGKDISDHKILLEIVNLLNLEPSDVEQRLNSNQDSNRLKLHLNLGREFGISGVPSYLMSDRMLIKGFQSISAWRSIINKLNVS